MELLKAYIVLPAQDIGYTYNEVDRAKYITDCLQNNIVSCLTESNSCIRARLALNSQNINDGFLDALDFPENINKRGTCVLVLQLDFNAGYYIIARLSENNQFHLDEEYQMKLIKNSGVNIAGIIIAGLNGNLDLFAHSKDDNGGKINIQSSNETDTAEVNLQTNIINLILNTYNINILDLFNIVIRPDLDTAKYTTIQYKVGSGFTFKDEFDNEINQNETLLELKHKNKINLGDGAEPLVLGNKIKDLLSEQNNNILGDLTAIVAALQTLYSFLGLPLPPSIMTNITAHFNSITTKLEQILSTYSNTD